MSIKAGQALCSFPLPRLYESSRQLMQTTISVVFFSGALWVKSAFTANNGIIHALYTCHDCALSKR